VSLDQLLDNVNKKNTSVQDDQMNPTETTSTEQPASNGAGDPEIMSKEDLIQAYREVQQLLAEMTEELDRSRRSLEQVGNTSRMHAMQAEDEAFSRRMRDYYAKDPFSATEIMIRKGQEELLAVMRTQMEEVVRDQENFKQGLGNFLNDPANARLRPFADELELLIRKKGMHPREAADLILKMQNKHNASAKRRSAAAADIRNRSVVESDGEIGEPTDDDKELDKIIKQSRTLDEMFAGLRKLRS
jgi:hypothetical protein